MVRHIIGYYEKVYNKVREFFDMPKHYDTIIEEIPIEQDIKLTIINKCSLEIELILYRGNIPEYSIHFMSSEKDESIREDIKEILNYIDVNSTTYRDYNNYTIPSEEDEDSLYSWEKWHEYDDELTQREREEELQEQLEARDKDYSFTELYNEFSNLDDI